MYLTITQHHNHHELYLLSLALTHDRVPDSPPLPDILLDSVQYQVKMLILNKMIMIVIMTDKDALGPHHDHDQQRFPRSIIMILIFLRNGV